MPGVIMPRAPGGASPRTFQLLQSVNASPASATHTYSAQNAGAADAARYLLAVLTADGNNNTSNATATIGGVSATRLVEAFSAVMHVAIFIALVPTGTTADVVASWGASKGRGTLTLYRSVDVGTITPVSTNTATVANGTAAGGPTLTVTDGGCALFGALSNASGPGGTHTWSGATEDYEVENTRTRSVASVNNLSAGTIGVTCTRSATSGDMIVAGVSF
jgi:hypothetical protein